jgi:hypothetical protein
MGASGGEGLDGTVFTQHVTAMAGGQVHAVQQGDQYNYIYRAKPPYHVEPFTFPGQIVTSSGPQRWPKRALITCRQLVRSRPCLELGELEAWRDDMSSALSVRLVHAEGDQSKARLVADFAERTAELKWNIAQARHCSEVTPTGGGQDFTIRSPGLLLVNHADDWPLEDLVTLIRRHRDAAHDRLRILLLGRTTGAWWQRLVHQFAKLDVVDVRVIRPRALPKIRYAEASSHLV